MIWLYNKNGAKLFNNIEEASSDYVDCPTKVKDNIEDASVGRDELKAIATALNIKFPNNIKTDKLIRLIEAKNDNGA